MERTERETESVYPPGKKSAHNKLNEMKQSKRSFLIDNEMCTCSPRDLPGGKEENSRNHQKMGREDMMSMRKKEERTMCLHRQGHA